MPMKFYDEDRVVEAIETVKPDLENGVWLHQEVYVDGKLTPIHSECLDGKDSCAKINSVWYRIPFFVGNPPTSNLLQFDINVKINLKTKKEV